MDTLHVIHLAYETPVTLAEYYNNLHNDESMA